MKNILITAYAIITVVLAVCFMGYLLYPNKGVADKGPAVARTEQPVPDSPRLERASPPALIEPPEMPATRYFDDIILHSNENAPAAAGYPFLTGLTSPHSLNIDFGVWKPNLSGKTGPAADGLIGDYWNAVGVPWNDNHTEAGLKSAQGPDSPITVQLINLGGGWTNNGSMGVRDPMYDTFDYPQNNQGGSAGVILRHIPAGRYHIYIYGHAIDAHMYGDYTLFIGRREFARKKTSAQTDAIDATSWAEGVQYVKFSDIELDGNTEVRILIRPGASGRTDALINGLQLIPIALSRPAATHAQLREQQGY